MLALTRFFLKNRAQDSAPAQATQASSPKANTANTSVPANGNSAADRLAITPKSENRNPYQGIAPSSAEVKVDRWGQGENGSLEQILNNQGYSSKDIYSKDEDGKSLLDRVSEVNGLKNPNLIRAGQTLTVPSKEQANREETPATPDTPVKPEAPEVVEKPATPVTPKVEEEKADEAKVNQVKVDAWGKGPNGSLDSILKNQGFTEKDIYLADENGDTLLKKVARANGLSDPDKIRAGQTLEVPNSKEALEQMDIPEPAPKTQVEEQPVVAPEETEKPVITPEQPKEETPVVVEPKVPATEPEESPVVDDSEDALDDNLTGIMGQMYRDAKAGHLDRKEFQHLNASASYYVQMRARYGKDGYTNEEIAKIGKLEDQFGADYADAALHDGAKFPLPPASTWEERHYQESGPLHDKIVSGELSSEETIQIMTEQRAEVRAWENNR